MAILHFIPDAADPAGIIRTLMEPLPAGSYLALGHHTADIFPELEDFARYPSKLTPDYTATLRSQDQVAGYFEGLELVAPGVVQISQWRPDSGLRLRPARRAVGRRGPEAGLTGLFGPGIWLLLYTRWVVKLPTCVPPVTGET